MNEIMQVLRICPAPIEQAICSLPHSERTRIEEIRLRNGQCPTYLRNNTAKLLLEQSVRPSMLREVIDKASQNSAYAAQDMLHNGFLTISGGHRLGVCGRGVYKEGAFYALRELSSINIRIAREHRGFADPIVGFLWTHPSSTLIIAPPAAGKTTLLRDLIRQLSERFSWRICVVDERMELAACVDGVPQFSLGAQTDILSAVRKPRAIEMLLRTMNPQWIALDEITAQTDVEAICAAAHCGVRFFATAHAASIEEMRRRELYRKLLQSNVFQNVVRIDAQRNLHTEVLTNG